MNFFRSLTFRIAALIWSGAMVGFVAMIMLHFPSLVPKLLNGRDPGISTYALLWLATAQSALLVGLAAWVGAKTAPAVGLGAPTVEAIATGRPAMPALMPQLTPGLGFGLLGGVFLFCINALGPDAWVDAQASYYPDLLPRLLFGGITEEVLLRWGLMSAVVWTLWQANGNRRQPARTSHMWGGIVAAAVLFGLAHLPAVSSAAGGMGAALGLYIVSGNALIGTLFGWLYWRYGLEAAIIAHACAHLVNHLVVQA